MTDNKYSDNDFVKQLNAELDETRHESESEVLGAYVQKYNNEEKRKKLADEYEKAGMTNVEQLYLTHSATGQPVEVGYSPKTGNPATLCKLTEDDVFLILKAEDFAGFPHTREIAGEMCLVAYHDYEKACAYSESVGIDIARGVSSVAKLSATDEKVNFDRELKIALKKGMSSVLFDGELYNISDYFAEKGVTDLSVTSNLGEIPRNSFDGVPDETKEYLEKMGEIYRNILEDIGFDKFQVYFENTSYPIPPVRCQEIIDQLIKAAELDDKDLLDFLGKNPLPENIWCYAGITPFYEINEGGVSMPWIAEELRILVGKWDRLEGLFKQVIDKQLALHKEFYMLINKKNNKWLEVNNFVQHGLIVLYTDAYREQLEKDYIFIEKNSLEQIMDEIRFKDQKSIIFSDGSKINYSFPIKKHN